MSLFAKKHIIWIKSIRYYLSTLQGVKKQKVGNPFRNGYDTIRVMRGFLAKERLSSVSVASEYTKESL